MKLIENERHVRKVARMKAEKIEVARGSESITPDIVLPGSTVSPIEELSPYNKVEESAKTPYETVLADVQVMRRSERYKTLFREYIRKQPLIDERFVDAHLSLFNEWETNALLDCMEFSEEFLGKYLATLDARKVATTQTFSEEFFMRHFGSFDAETVLTKGKNEWRAKDKRSRKLDTFLRLKGVRC